MLLLLYVCPQCVQRRTELGICVHFRNNDQRPQANNTQTHEHTQNVRTRKMYVHQVETQDRVCSLFRAYCRCCWLMIATTIQCHATHTRIRLCLRCCLRLWLCSLLLLCDSCQLLLRAALPTRQTHRRTHTPSTRLSVICMCRAQGTGSAHTQSHTRTQHVRPHKMYRFASCILVHTSAVAYTHSLCLISTEGRTHTRRTTQKPAFEIEQAANTTCVRGTERDKEKRRRDLN